MPVGWDMYIKTDTGEITTDDVMCKGSAGPVDTAMIVSERVRKHTSIILFWC